ncbi:hypothetical protein [Candidatus Amarobacter glycogenicus]|uniref:ammonium transporter n=1 Tax=Candidatus Amarobacter glycogenicus TaxID=3140699 RepID=UPI0031CC74E8
MVGGTAALVGAKVVGPRMGKFNKDGSVNAIPGHNITSGMLGLFILWFGWYGFNPGSTLSRPADSPPSRGKVAVTTTLAACAAAVTAVVATKIKTNRYDLGLVVNGVLGGLVGITAGCATVEPWAAVVIGIVAAIIVIYAVDLLDNVLKIDDPVGAAPVHLFTGLWGVIAVGLFSSESGMAAAYGGESGAYGLLLGGGAEQLMAQLIGAVTILTWTGALSAFIFLAIKYTHGTSRAARRRIQGPGPARARHRCLPGLRAFRHRHLQHGGRQVNPGLRHKHAERSQRGVTHS